MRTTPFDKKVYNVVRRIPQGRVLTYAECARMIGSPRATRAVGNALNKNTDPGVPCHRVVRSDGAIGGFNRGTRKKIALLRREGVRIARGRVAR